MRLRGRTARPVVTLCSSAERLGGESDPPKLTNAKDFELKRQVRDLFDELARLENGTVARLELIQHYKNDPSLSDLEIAKIAKWADSRAPEGNPADLPPPIPLIDGTKWNLGEPDLIVSTPEIAVKAGAPDWWGELEAAPTGLTEDRGVKSVEMREVNDIPPDKGGGRATVGARYVLHHVI